MLRFLIHCGQSVAVEFTAQLRHAGAHYLRLQSKVWARTSLAGTPWPDKGFAKLRLFQLNGPVQTTLTRVMNNQFDLDPLDGLPIVIEDRFFLGVEHPLAVHAPRSDSINATHWQGASGDINHLRNLKQPSEQSPWQYGAVFGTFSESSQSRRAFVTYLHNERPGRRSPMA